MLCFATRNSFSPLTGLDLVRTCALLGSSVVDAFAGADRVGAFLTALLYGDHSAKAFHAKLRLFPSEYSPTPLRPARARDRSTKRLLPSFQIPGELLSCSDRRKNRSGPDIAPASSDEASPVARMAGREEYHGWNGIFDSSLKPTEAWLTSPLFVRGL